MQERERGQLGLDFPRRLVARDQALGLSRIETCFCAGARHELLNETNSDEVQRNALA